MSNKEPIRPHWTLNDYIELESQIAKANEHINRLKSFNIKLVRSLEDKDRQIISLEQKILNNSILTVDINDYIELRNSANHLREENNKKSENFSAMYTIGGESGSYKTPVKVIDANLNWTKKAIEICEKIAEKLGLNK